MIDHLVGKPSPSWKRTQVFLVIWFWAWRILRGDPDAPRFLYSRRINKFLKRFTPWQIVVSVLTAVYAVRNFDKILGLEAPEPLAQLYSPSYYRAVWIATGLDAGFATAMNIRPKWLKDICSVIFSVYYIMYPSEADEKIRRYRAVPTVQMLRATWNKTTNPIIRTVTHMNLPSLVVRRKILLPRPHASDYKRPITAVLYYDGPESELCTTTDLILDYPGGGFVAMSPDHHDERLYSWAKMTGRPILSIDYGKAPEYPYPFAIDEAFDTYRVLVESVGTLIGMSGRHLNIILTGDSAGGCLAVNVVVKILEHNSMKHSDKPLITLPHPVAILLSYAALDFNFTSWMTADHLKILRSEQSSGNLPGLKEFAAQKDHLKHVSPLSMVGDRKSSRPRRKGLKRQTSWRDRIKNLASSGGEDNDESPISSPIIRTKPSSWSLRTPTTRKSFSTHGRGNTANTDGGALADAESSDSDESDYNQFAEEDRPLSARVRYVYPHSVPNPVKIPWSQSSMDLQQAELSKVVKEEDDRVIVQRTEMIKKGEVEAIGSRLTMTSRSGFFNDRIISPSMMRAMAILYVGPHRNPEFTTDYYLSPILTPSHLLAQFPPVLMQCGEKDPFVDDTILFSGRLRQAKRARKMELDLAISGKSARFGESLRMSISENAGQLDAKKLAELRKERDRLANETEDDWVQTVLFSDWSHGYLQMPTLLPEAQAVIEELAEWLTAVFESGSPPASGENSHTDLAGSSTAVPAYSASETETDDTGITFVTRKHASRRNSPLPSIANSDREEFVSNQPTHRKTPSYSARDDSSDATLHNTGSDGSQKAASPPEMLLAPPTPPMRGDILGPVELDYDSDHLAALQVNSDSGNGGSGTGTPKRPGTTPRPSGQKISEAELMRRRRLIDSYVGPERVD